MLCLLAQPRDLQDSVCLMQHHVHVHVADADADYVLLIAVLQKKDMAPLLKGQQTLLATPKGAITQQSMGNM